MKIAVLVKEVPDAAVQKRIDPATGRMDRSGEKNLNPYDTHAIEAAMQIREGGAVDVDEIVAVTMGPETAVAVTVRRPIARSTTKSTREAPAATRRTVTRSQSAGSCGAKRSRWPASLTSMPKRPRTSGLTTIASDHTW